MVLSKFTQKKLEDVYGIPEAKIHVIPGGIDLGRFHPVSDKAEIRAKLNIPKNHIVLFTVRNLVQRMGLENLIEAFNVMKQESADMHLIIGGNGLLKNEIYVKTLIKLGLFLSFFLQGFNFIP